MAIDRARIHDLFFAECEELLARAERLLQAGACARHCAEEVATVCRYLHSIAGAARMLGFAPVAELAAGFEDVLRGLPDHAPGRGAEVDDVGLRVIAALRALLACGRDGSAVSAERVEPVLAALARIVRDVRADAALGQAAGGPVVVELRFVLSRAACSEVLLDEMFDGLRRLGELQGAVAPEDGAAAGEWCIRMRTAQGPAALRRVLDHVVEPGSLRVEWPHGAAADAPDDAARHPPAAGAGLRLGSIEGSAALSVVRALARDVTGLAAIARAQVAAFETLLAALRRAPRDSAAWRDGGALVEAMRRIGAAIRQGERAAVGLASSIEMLERMVDVHDADDAPNDAGSAPAERPVIDARPLPLHRQAASMRPLAARRRRSGAPLPKVGRGSGGPGSEMEVDWEMYRE
jgi:HPt (histidine-containing phosphotransfer) domain-containing protein